MQTKKIAIEIWSDIVCPFCFIGKKKMEKAVSRLNANEQVDIIWRSFQLDPDFPMNQSISTSEHLVQRKGYPLEQVNLMMGQLANQGKEYGIDFQFDKARSFNTIDAHRLIHWAKEENKSDELKEALMLYYFTEGFDLSITDNLMVVIEKVGLDVAKAKEVLTTNAYAEHVEQDITQARKLGVRGVPYFLINGKEHISGAQHDSVFENILTAALTDQKLADSGNPEGVCIANEECT
jgi:predicted DsbA family dithiol-disulfide isomerase